MLNTPYLRKARHYGTFGDGLCACHICKEKRLIQAKKRKAIGICVITIILLLVLIRFSNASTIIKEANIAGYSLNQWCEAIRHAEGVHSNHPYGILTKYKHTSPKQACANTVLHKYKDYSALPSKTRQSKRFLAYLQEHYCPIGSDTDNGTCKNWQGNVKYWLERG